VSNRFTHPSICLNAHFIPLMLQTWILLVKFFGFNPHSPSLVNSALKIFACFEASADQW
jgi:hypothetical protein